MPSSWPAWERPEPEKMKLIAARAVEATVTTGSISGISRFFAAVMVATRKSGRKPKAWAPLPRDRRMSLSWATRRRVGMPPPGKEASMPVTSPSNISCSGPGR